jgi:hypothetical protein
MLRSRRRTVEVSSTLLWDRVGAPVSSAVPWQRLRLTTLLLVQLAVLAGFVLSLSRPFFTQQTLLGPHTVLVIDSSGSMSMAGRLERAVGEARSLAADVSAANLISVVDAGPQPRVLASFAQTKEAVDRGLAAISASGGRADLSGAIALARGLATPDRPTNVLLFSDGGDAPLIEEPVIGATQIRFDESGPDLSVDSISPDPSGEGVVRAFVSVSNHTGGTRSAGLQVAINGVPAGVFDLDVPGLSSAGRTFPIDAVPGDVVSVSLPAGDALALDDTAWMILSGGPDRIVDIRGEGSPFLAALVDIAPGFVRGETDADVMVVDRGPLPEIDKPAWLIRTETVPEGVELGALVQNAVVTYQRPGEPILDSVDLSEMAVAEAQVVSSNQWVPLVRAGDAPLLLLGEVGGHRVVYQTFDLTQSNLPVQVGFPILGARLLEWLAGASPGAVTAGLAGEPIAISTPAGAIAQVTLPGGEARELDPTAAVFRDTFAPGVYTVEYRLADGSIQTGSTSIRGFDPTEAAAVPRTIATTAGATGGDQTATIVQEWAPWFLAGVLMLMVLEWWIGHQRPGFGRKRGATA